MERLYGGLKTKFVNFERGFVAVSVYAGELATVCQMPWNRLRAKLLGWNQSLLAAFAIALMVMVVTRSLWFSDGLPLFGDWVPPAQGYVNHIISVWNPYERNGTINIDLRTFPWLGLHALLAGPIGGLRFRLVSDLFVALTLAWPMATTWYVARRLVHSNLLQALVIALLYGLNPWVAGQLAAGHLGILLGYGLLPVITIVGFTRQGRSFLIPASLLLGLAVTFDFHTAILGAVVLGVCRIAQGGKPAQIARDVSVALGLSIVVSAYWVLPTITAISRIPYRPISLAPNPQTQATLAQMADPAHVLATRSNWWIPFSDGLYSYGWLSKVVSTALLLLPLVLLWHIMSCRNCVRDLRARAGIALLLLGTVPQVYAHWFPASYAQLARLPLGAFFRDVTDFTPLFILALAFLAVASRPWGGILRVGAMITCLAAVLPWMSGDLRGNAGPIAISDGQLEAIQWLNSNAMPETHTMWLPMDLYVKFPWSSHLVSDPVREWADQRLLNPIADPAYDFSPGITASLISLDALMSSPLQGTELAEVLAHIGVRYVVTRVDVQSSAVTRDQDHVLASASGLRLVKQFRDTKVYEVLQQPRSDIAVGTAVTLFTGGWRALAKSILIDPGLSRVYVPVDAPGARAVLEHTRGTSLTLGSNAWDAVFGFQRLITPPDQLAREAYPFDPKLGYAYDAGETVQFSSTGIAAVRVLAGNSDASLTCAPQGKPVNQPIAFEQPESLPRWYAIRCNGQARLIFHGHAFLEGYETMTESEFIKRLRLIAGAMLRSGSGYLIQGPETGDVLPLLPAGSTMTGSTSTWRENPIVVEAGQYEVELRCVAICGSGTLELLPIPPADWADGLGSEVFAGSPRTGAPPIAISLPAQGSGITVRQGLREGAYELLIRGLPADRLQSLVIKQGNATPGLPASLSTLSQQRINKVPPAVVVALNQAPGPWSVTMADKRTVSLTPADLLGSAYFPDGLGSEVSLLDITALEIAGALVSLALGAIMVVILRHNRSAEERSGQIS